VLQGSWAVGYLFAAGVSAVVLPIWGWRALFVCAAAPALLVFPIRFWITESPEWKAASAARRAAPKAPSSVSLAKIAWASISMGLGFGAYYALAGLYPTLLTVELHADARTIAWLVGLFNVGMLVGSVGCGMLAARRGVAIAIILPALGSLLALPLYVGAVPGLLGVGAFLGGALGVGFCGVVPMLLTGMFDAADRARYVGIVYHVGAALAALVPPATVALATYAHARMSLAVGVVAGTCEIGLALVVLAGMTGERSLPLVTDTNGVVQ
jgi:SHS family lactate transporter-like MFS transporter